MKRVLYLAVAALVAMLILVPTAMAQDQTVMIEQTVTQ
jgi:ABC-type long-subunit fatty acid transport system fused permease/ATPase subunit